MPTREKLISFLKINNFDAMFEQLITKITDMFRGGFESVGQTIPNELITAVDKTCRSRRVIFENTLIEIYGKNIIEEDLDSLIAFQESPTGRRLASLGLTIRDALVKAEDAWTNDTIKSMDAELHRLLDFATPVEEEPPTAA